MTGDLIIDSNFADVTSEIFQDVTPVLNLYRVLKFNSFQFSS